EPKCGPPRSGRPLPGASNARARPTTRPRGRVAPFGCRDRTVPGIQDGVSAGSSTPCIFFILAYRRLPPGSGRMFARVAAMVRRVFARGRVRRPAWGSPLALESLEERLAPASVLLPGGPVACTCPFCTGLGRALPAASPAQGDPYLAPGALGAAGDAYVLGGS